MLLQQMPIKDTLLYVKHSVKILQMVAIFDEIYTLHVHVGFRSKRNGHYATML